MQSGLKSENDTDYWPDKDNLLNKNTSDFPDNLERLCGCVVSLVVLRVYYRDMKLNNESIHSWEERNLKVFLHIMYKIVLSSIISLTLNLIYR